MKIETLKDLESLVKMCNKHGVRNITVDGISMLLDGPPDLKTEESKAADPIKTPDAYTDEDVLLWSAGNF